MRQFGYLLIRVMVVIVLFVLAVNLLLARPLIESLLFAVALTVGLSPELLPAIISVTLSAGARAMSARGVIVRRLDAIENLGSMNILCTDKTGTLTEGAIVLSDVLDAANRPSDEVRRLALVNAALETGIENPLDAAIVAAGGTAGLTDVGSDQDRRDPLRLRAPPPDHRGGRGHRAGPASDRHQGSLREVLDICTSMERDGAEVRLDHAARAELDAVFRTKGEQGFRVLALATRRVPAKPDYDRQDEREMVFRGFLEFLDPPKPDAREPIRNLARRGINIKVVSGDNRHVTAHIAEAVGLDPRAMLTGEDVAGMNDEALCLPRAAH